MSDEEHAAARDHLAAVRAIVERSIVMGRMRLSAETEPLLSDIEHVERLEMLRAKILDARAWLGFL